jgi:queuosine precursor transporter
MAASPPAEREMLDCYSTAVCRIRTFPFPAGLAAAFNIEGVPAFIERITTKHHTLRNFRYYDLLVHVFVVVLLISNLVGAKISAIGGFRVSGAQLLFPITYIFGDIFTEVYGYSGSRRAIWIGFFASGLMALMGLFVVWVPAAPGWGDQAAFETVFYQVPRMIVASLIAFWAGEFTNSYVLAKMKLLTRGRYLWMRTIGSTVAGQAVDTATVITLAFAGRTDWATIGNMIASGYLFKVVYEALATPLTYLIVNALKRAEGVDVYDTDTNFNPFGSEKVQVEQSAAAGEPPVEVTRD